MSNGVRDYLCRWLKCSSQCENALVQCQQIKAELELELAEVKEENERLKQVVPYPPPPKIENISQKDTAWVQQVLDGMNLNIQRLPLDQTYYLCSQTDFLNIVAWDWVDTYEYRKETFDCENFAFLFKARMDLFFGLNQVGLVVDYGAGHAYNIVLYPNGKVQILEPQSDALWFWDVRPNVYELQGAIVLI